MTWMSFHMNNRFLRTIFPPKVPRVILTMFELSYVGVVGIR